MGLENDEAEASRSGNVHNCHTDRPIQTDQLADRWTEKVTNSYTSYTDGRWQPVKDENRN